MPAKNTFQSIRVRGPASFDQAIRVKGQDWPPDEITVPPHEHSADDITSGQLPDARIASAAAWHAKGDPNVSGQSVLAANFNITAALNVEQDTGLSIQLPSAGTYLLMCDVRATVNLAAGAWALIAVSLYNQTDGAKVADSEALVVYTETAAKNFIASASIQVRVTVAAAKTIRLRALRNASQASFTTSTIDTTTISKTRLIYVRLS